MVSTAVSHMSVDSAPWFWFTPPSLESVMTAPVGHVRDHQLALVVAQEPRVGGFRGPPVAGVRGDVVRGLGGQDERGRLDGLLLEPAPGAATRPPAVVADGREHAVVAWSGWR